MPIPELKFKLLIGFFSLFVHEFVLLIKLGPPFKGLGAFGALGKGMESFRKVGFSEVC
jgi:hypothetical protein